MWTVSIEHRKQGMKRYSLYLRLFVAIMMCMSVATELAFSAEDGLKDEVLEHMEFDTEAEYSIRLVTGDVITGPITEVGTDSIGAFVRIKALFGRARLYASEIAWIGLRAHSYRARNRGFIIPTAEGIGSDHYIALVEGVMPTFGIGIGDVLSVTGGRTVVPGIGAENQFSTVNIKASVYNDANGLVEGGKQFYAFGVNGAWINDVNFMGHLYGVATFTGKRARVSTMIHAKLFGKDVYNVSGGSLFSPFAFPFPNGSIGLAMMLDVRFPTMHDLHFLGEIWNADIARPSQSALFIGLRHGNTSVTFDFGLTLLPGPNIAPAFSFAWMPW